MVVAGAAPGEGEGDGGVGGGPSCARTSLFKERKIASVSITEVLSGEEIGAVPCVLP
jgi:hypothetical protein